MQPTKKDLYLRSNGRRSTWLTPPTNRFCASDRCQKPFEEMVMTSWCWSICKWEGVTEWEWEWEWARVRLAFGIPWAQPGVRSLRSWWCAIVPGSASVHCCWLRDELDKCWPPFAAVHLPHHRWAAAQIKGKLHKAIVQIQSYKIAALLRPRIEYQTVRLLRLQYDLQLQPDQSAVAQRRIAQKRGAIEGGHLMNGQNYIELLWLAFHSTPHSPANPCVSRTNHRQSQSDTGKQRPDPRANTFRHAGKDNARTCPSSNPLMNKETK